MKNTEVKVEAETTDVVDAFPKDAILKSKRYANRRDALSFLLHDGVMYTHADVDKILNDYYERTVN